MALLNGLLKHGAWISISEANGPGVSFGRKRGDPESESQNADFEIKKMQSKITPPYVSFYLETCHGRHYVASHVATFSLVIMRRAR